MNKLSDLSLEDLLPHRAAMLLVGEIIEVGDAHAVTQSRVDRAWPMADAWGVSSLICVELAAQTAGVCNGWERVRVRGKDSEQMGWLVAVKRADFFVDSLPLDIAVTTRAENTMAYDKFREVSSQLYYNDQLVAEVVLQLYQA